MAIVWQTPLGVEQYVAFGRCLVVPRLGCTACGEPMSFWGWYERDLRAGKSQTLLVRRQRCKPCATSHAVLPSFMAQGRLDAIGVIGAALEAMVAQPGTGAGVARAIDVPEAVTVLDAYAVIAYLRAEPAAGEVRPLLNSGDATLTAVGVAEVLDHLVRLAGADEEDAALDLAELGLLEGMVVDSDLGLAAGRLRARRYHPSRCSVSMADCIAAEAARHAATSLATSDPPLLDLCRIEGISAIVLTASDGTRWAPPDSW